ncbi:MAG: PEP/pyruvate-binding domain-containing protein, partial [Acidobacteriota bacterium]|nr:PEP/pyruvate-binding domain-containing protein [Acidobacteriota bacterium]
MRNSLGGKGAGLAEMTNAGLPVPPGFTISADVCGLYYARGGKLPGSLDKEILKHLMRLERVTDAKFGSTENPLLVSVRSGSRFSMPGMMDTILNLGLNDKTVEGLKRKTRNGRFAADSYRRFIQMFGNVVLDISREAFDGVFERVKRDQRTRQDTGLSEK